MDLDLDFWNMSIYIHTYCKQLFGFTQCLKFLFTKNSHFFHDPFGFNYQNCYHTVHLINRSLTIEKTPEIIQTTSAILTLPVCISTPVGETKIPEPMIEPTITVQPFSRLILALRPTSPSAWSAPSGLAAVGLPFELLSNGEFSSIDPFFSFVASLFVIAADFFLLQFCFNWFFLIYAYFLYVNNTNIHWPNLWGKKTLKWSWELIILNQIQLENDNNTALYNWMRSIKSITKLRIDVIFYC